jgi:tetratricopeptide (TPR) repeat protein
MVWMNLDRNTGRVKRQKHIHLRTSFSGIVSVAVALLAGCHGKDRLPATDTRAYADYAATFYTGLAALQVGDDVRAESSLAKATKLVPGEPAGWADWGILAFRQRTFDEASQRLQRAHALAPNDDRIDYLLGLIEAGRGDSGAAIGDFKKAVAANPRNLRALYRLAGEVERQGAADSDAEVQKLMQQLVEAEPDNLAALVDLCRISAKRGDTATLHATIDRLAQLSKNWPAESQQQLAELQAAAASAAPRSAAMRSTFLRNVLMRQPEFRDSLSEIAAQPGEEAEPITSFLRLQNLPSQPSPPDTAITFANEPVSSAAGAWKWIGAIALNGNDPPVIAEANGQQVHLASGATLGFPGGPAATPPGPESVLALDYNYDFKNDLLLAGAGGLRLFRQDQPAAFTDVTAAMKLPTSVSSTAYTGAWAIDIEADGDLDVVVGTERGLPTVLQNNGDGTFTPIHPFAAVSGIRQFAWGDLNGDGNPDAALIDGDGALHVFLNQRNGRFEETKLGETKPGDGQRDAVALTIANTSSDGFLRLHVLRADGSIVAYAWREKTLDWAAQPIAQLAVKPPGVLRLQAADVDNNGAVDLVVLPVANPAAGATVLLQDAAGAFHAIAQPLGPALAFAAVDLHNDGRLDLLGLSADGHALDARNHGTKQYHWQTIRPRARQATGDQRINPFGIGGDIEIRSGLLLQKQPIDSPILHFGLGDRQTVDVARIVWPNGTVRAEFNLQSNQQIVTEQRLKGSCPFLFAWNGTRMDFVKDSVPWGSAIGLRINALGTAKISATEEWYKIPGDALRPRDGYYDLRVTGELWESYYYDSLTLMTVDHPQGTEVFTDERFDVPAVKLAVTAVREPQPLKNAVDDEGHDATATLRTLDGKYLDTFGRGQYQGITRDHYVELDLGEKVPTTGPVWLIAKGWLHPSDSTVNIAMGQGVHARPQWLSLEVPNGRGGWRVAKPNLGFPAGRNKICLIDITGLFQPGAPHRLRLRTNLEVYWDSIEWAQGLPTTPMKIQRLQPAFANLHYRGFSTIHQANASSPEIPDYAKLASTAPQWRDLSGFYTRFGDVKELLAATDDRYVIMNAGDELSLRYAAPPPPPQGWVRDYVIAGDGWIKDGDYNSTASRTVMPYPYHARREYDAPPTSLENDWEVQHHREDWQTYQTRYVDARGFRDALVDRATP